MALSYFFILFIIYGFIGWLWETIFCSVKQKEFINRGFLKGPWLPIYGIGSIIVLHLLKPLSGTWIPLFFASLILTTSLEYFTSWFLEKLFHTKWWDYSSVKFNINGRVCLLGALFFGLLGTLISHFLNPIIESFVLSIPLLVAKIIASVLFTIFLCDLLYTIYKLVDYTIYMERLKVFVEILKEKYSEEKWFFEHISISELFNTLKEKSKQRQIKINQNLLDRIDHFNENHKQMLVWIKKFPTMKSSRFSTGIEHLKKKLLEKLSNKR